MDQNGQRPVLPSPTTDQELHDHLVRHHGYSEPHMRYGSKQSRWESHAREHTPKPVVAVWSRDPMATLGEPYDWSEHRHPETG